MTYDDELAAGQADLGARRFASARMHFGHAHGLGRNVRRRHMVAHHGMLEVALRTFDIREVASPAFLIGATYAYERPARG